MSRQYIGQNSIYYVSIQEDKVVGGAGIYPTEGLPFSTCELVKMYLLPQARGKGIGKALIELCLEFAFSKGYKSVI